MLQLHQIFRPISAVTVVGAPLITLLQLKMMTDDVKSDLCDQPLSITCTVPCRYT
jgi:hypothetical protein